MSDYLPIEVQTEIMKLLPIKSLIQCRSVSKQWKSLIDSSKFIQEYHLLHPNPPHHLLIHSSDGYTSIIDDETFPQQRFPFTIPESLNLITPALCIGSDNGLLCYTGAHNGVEMAVIWNPCFRKSVSIAIPNDLEFYVDTVIGFGVCPDPMLVKILVVEEYKMWVVKVFSLTKRAWKTVYEGEPFKPRGLFSNQVSIAGVVYWSGYYDMESEDEIDSDEEEYTCKCVISFDLKSEEFGQVRLSMGLEYTEYLVVAKVNESLALLEYNRDDYNMENETCVVWMRQDGENNPFTKIYTIKVEGRSMYNSVLGLRKNREALLELEEDDDTENTEIQVYPLSGAIHGIGIFGKCRRFSVRSFMETLLLLDESNTIIN